jgi:2-polyprenyl-3-methyl-5-hydroxy-6-metoxy-1,4-benzoquinol methylase
MEANERCQICLNTIGSLRLQTREMLFGTEEIFTYAECLTCGSLTLCDPPAEMSRFYPSDYYSFQEPTVRALPTRLRLAARRLRSNLIMGGFDTRPVEAVFRGRSPRRTEEFLDWSVWFRGFRTNSRILDVGAGNGSLLLELQQLGFTDLQGFDPYIERDISYPDGVRVSRTLLPEQPPFDLIMLHHTFEHMPNPLDSLRMLAGLLSPAGTILLRMPVGGSYAYRRYRGHWVGLDPPRHLHVLTPRGVDIVAKAAGLEVVSVVYDSTSFQFWASEQYCRKVALMDPRSYSIDPGASIFSAGDIDRYKAQASALNRTADGDTAGFFLKFANDA